MSTIPAGYKQTEIGVIPEDWEYRSIKELIESNAIEKPIDGNHGNIHPKSSDFVESGIPFIMANDIQNNKINLDKCHFIKKVQADSLQKGFSIEGDVLLTHKGTVGNTAIVGTIKTEYIMLTPQVTYYRVKNSDTLMNRYIKHFFDSDMFQFILKNISGGGTRAYIGIVAQQNLPFILPPIADQQLIATALSDTDALIESLEKLIAKKRHIKQGAMQELLSPKEGWEVKKLGDISHIKTGSKNNQDKVEDGKYPFFVRSATVERINSYSHDCEAILIPGEGNIGSIFHYINGRFDVHQRVYAITEFEKNIDGKFIYLYIVKNFGKHALQNSVKATVDSLRLPTFLEFDISMPKNKTEQTAIATILSDMDVEITALEERLEKTRSLKSGMMHELLTGRIRLI